MSGLLVGMVSAGMAVDTQGAGMGSPVYCLEIKAGDGGTRFGTGVQLLPGRVLTVWHGIEGAAVVWVYAGDGLRSPARVLAQDATKDMALLRIAGRGGRVTLTPAAPLAGAAVSAIGCPAGEGLVSHRGVLRDPARRIDGRVMLEVAMDVTGGDSGAPLFDSRGRLLGLIRGYRRDAPGSGYAVPALAVARFLLQAGFPLARILDFEALRRGVPGDGDGAWGALLRELAGPVQADARPFYVLGWLYHRRREHRRSLDYLLEAAARDSRDRRVFEALCQVYGALGWEGARRRSCRYAASLAAEGGRDG